MTELLKRGVIAVALLVLVACAPPPRYDGAPADTGAQGGTGVTVSGSARVGVTRTF